VASSINAQEGGLRAAATPSVVPGSAVTGGMAQGQSSLALALLDSLQRNMSEDADEGHRLLEVFLMMRRVTEREEPKTMHKTITTTYKYV
jgi:hypothetical protein